MASRAATSRWPSTWRATSERWPPSLVYFRSDVRGWPGPRCASRPWLRTGRSRRAPAPVPGGCHGARRRRRRSRRGTGSPVRCARRRWRLAISRRGAALVDARRRASLAAVAGRARDRMPVPAPARRSRLGLRDSGPGSDQRRRTGRHARVGAVAGARRRPGGGARPGRLTLGCRADRGHAARRAPRERGALRFPARDSGHRRRGREGDARSGGRAACRRAGWRRSASALVASGLVGYVAIAGFLRYVARHTLDAFALYRIGLAAAVLLAR